MQQEAKQFSTGLKWIYHQLKATGRGKHVGRFSYYHSTLVAQAPGVADRLAEVRQATHAKPFPCNALKLDANSRISFLRYESFDAPFPVLLACLSCDMEQRTARFIDYCFRRNPPILHRKELLLLASDPRVSAATRLTERLEREGAFRKPSSIGTRNGWRQCLSDLGIDIKATEQPFP